MLSIVAEDADGGWITMSADKSGQPGINSCLPIAPFGDRTVICVAGGQSLTLGQVRQIGIARSQDKIRVVAVNDAAFPCWFADICLGYDRKWWDSKAGLPGFRGLKLSVEPTGYHDVRVLEHGGIEGFDERPGWLRTGSNSGYGAVHIAAALGARKIVLVGYNFGSDADRGAMEHWFGLHPEGMNKGSNTDEWCRLFRGLTDILASRGVAVLNATPRSRITWLPGVDLASLVDEIRPTCLAAR